ncbi:MAG: hypothetical protein ACO1SX_07185 [Actinomycetota bacterium]
MKVEKLDSKQVPQVIILGVVSAGVLGYAAYNIAFGGPKRTAPAGKAAASTVTSSSPSVAATVAAVDGVEVNVAKNTAPELTLPSQFNPDPFKSAARPQAAKPAAAPAVGVTSKPAAKAAALPVNVPVIPAAGKGALLAPAPAPPFVPPPKPEKPDVRVTGTSMVDGMNLALLEVGQDHRVVQVGDLVAKGYRVKKINLDGVLFANKKDSFFRHVGVKDEPKKDEDSEGSQPQS